MRKKEKSFVIVLKPKNSSPMLFFVSTLQDKKHIIYAPTEYFYFCARTEEIRTASSTIVVMHWVFRNPEGFCKKLSMEILGARCIVPKKKETVTSITAFANASRMVFIEGLLYSLAGLL